MALGLLVLRSLLNMKVEISGGQTDEIELEIKIGEVLVYKVRAWKSPAQRRQD